MPRPSGRLPKADVSRRFHTTEVKLWGIEGAGSGGRAPVLLAEGWFYREQFFFYDIVWAYPCSNQASTVMIFRISQPEFPMAFTAVHVKV